jgi:hypothetical protein
MTPGYHRAEGTRHAALAWLRATDAEWMELMGDRYVELAKSLGSSDDEVDTALAQNGELGLSAALAEDLA